MERSEREEKKCRGKTDGREQTEWETEEVERREKNGEEKEGRRQ